MLTEKSKKEGLPASASRSVPLIFFFSEGRGRALRKPWNFERSQARGIAGDAMNAGFFFLRQILLALNFKIFFLQK